MRNKRIRTACAVNTRAKHWTDLDPWLTRSAAVASSSHAGVARADGRSVITKQHDCHVWVGSLVHNIPILGWLYEVPFR